jgi:serine/threonine protein phosphatase 1
LKLEKQPRTFVIGDIHGAHKALIQCFERSGFDYTSDKLISLGDVCDGWPEVHKVFNELCSIQNLVYIIGNHDEWALTWADTGEASYVWLAQGGRSTTECYPSGMDKEHKNLLLEAYDHYQENNQLFVHGGIDPHRPIAEQDRETFIWDRNLVNLALYNKDLGIENPLTDFSQIFVGHTPTIKYGSELPIHACEVRMMDTGAGYYGKLTMMDLESGEIFQSDPVHGLYPDHPGRMR